jgi:beta-glucosidase
LSQDAGVAPASDARQWFANGQPSAGWSLRVEAADASGSTRVTAVPIDALGGRVHVSARDFAVQEGARRFAVASGAATIGLMPPAPLNIARETNGDVLLLLTLRVTQAPLHASIGATCADPACHAEIPVVLPAADRWVRYGLPLKCLAAHGADMTRLGEAFRLSLDGPADVTIGEVRLGNDPEQTLPCP